MIDTIIDVLDIFALFDERKRPLSKIYNVKCFWKNIWFSDTCVPCKTTYTGIVTLIFFQVIYGSRVFFTNESKYTFHITILV